LKANHLNLNIQEKINSTLDVHFFLNICSLIMDNSFLCNCCSSRLVDKLALTTTLNPNPYKLQWIKVVGGIVANKQVYLSPYEITI